MSEPIQFTAIGNYRTIKYETPFEKVKNFRGWVVDTENEVPDYSYLFYEFRWSLNGSNWSLWSELTNDNIGMLDLNPDNKFYLEFRITAKSNPDSTSPGMGLSEGAPVDPPILLNNFAPDLVYDYPDQRDFATAPKIICSKELYDKPIIFRDDCEPQFKPYDVNRGINIYMDLSRTVNTIFGHEVNYYSVQPNGRGKDVILKEYNLFDVVDEKCVKVMVPQNQFPDNKATFDTFGIQFEQPFEIHIDRKYFESIFGKGAQPRKRDVIFFPLTNRIYQIESTYLHRDFNYYPVYFKCSLIKYEVKKNTKFKNTDAEKELMDYTVNTKDLFGEETKSEIEKVTKPQQYFVSSHRRNEDPIRSYVNKDVPIIEYDLNNNWTIVFNSYYDLNTLFQDKTDPVGVSDYDREAVRYKNSPFLSEDQELSFTCWFKMVNYTDVSKLVYKPPRKVQIASYTQDNGTITFNTYPYKHELRMGNNPSGYVSIYGDAARIGGHKLLSVSDDYTFTIKDNGTPITSSIATWRIQRAEARTLFYGTDGTKGITIQAIWTGSNPVDGSKSDYLQVGSFRVVINDLEILSPFGQGITTDLGTFAPTTEDWYGFVFNISNVYKQYSINAWKMIYDPENPNAQVSDLQLLHYKEGILDKKYTFSFPEELETDHDKPQWNTDNNAYKTLSSPIFLTNLRIFQNMIETEKQSAILNQNVVGDSQLAILIDNAKPILRQPKIAKNR